MWTMQLAVCTSNLFAISSLQVPLLHGNFHVTSKDWNTQMDRYTGGQTKWLLYLLLLAKAEILYVNKSKRLLSLPMVKIWKQNGYAECMIKIYAFTVNTSMMCVKLYESGGGHCRLRSQGSEHCTLYKSNITHITEVKTGREMYIHTKRQSLNDRKTL